MKLRVDAGLFARIGCLVAVWLLGSMWIAPSAASAADAESRIAAAKKWIDQEFQPSVLTPEEQLQEMKWFIEASEPFRGMTIRSVAETIKTHTYEAEVLAKAFEEITGIRVIHDIIGEGDVIEKLQTQMYTDTNIYHIYVNDTDLIGTHLRYDTAVNLTEFMAGEGADVTNPYLDLDDFLNLEFGQDYAGNQLQLPDQQFTNLYWFRYDWFNDPEIKAEFREQYGYELGVPVNWAAYEDIADFFTNHVKSIDGVRVYGHMDYGKKSPSLGWRFTDAWLSIAGVGDKGLPNGLPVDEWGIRVEDGHPVGSSVARGGATNSPAAYYATRKYVEWLKKYAPPAAASMTWSEAGPVPGQGHIAQRVFQYTTWLSNEAFTSPESPVTYADGSPRWRLAPTPHGKYWEEGMKVGYQDAGSWTIPTSVTGKYRKAAWLWAQFCVSKTVSLKKFNVGKTPVRKSTVFSDYWAARDGQLGGLITFYTSPVENRWTPTGPNVPDYPKLSQLWWQNISLAVTGQVTAKEAMDRLAEQQDAILARLERAGMKRFSPELNPERSREYWLSQPGAPKPERPAKEPKTVQYEELIKRWASQ